MGDEARHHDGYVPPFANVDMIPPHHPQNVEVAPVQQKANTFEIKTSTITLLENRCQFYGFPSEDPNAHISKFLEVCNTFKIPNVTEDQIKLRLLTKEIIDFFQHDGEALYGAWERFNELQQSCPHHHLQKEHLIQIFYNSINEHTRATIDAASGGSIMRKTYEEALALLDELATNSSSWPTERLRQTNQRGMMTLEQIQELEAMKTKNASLQAQVDLYKRQRNAPIAAVQAGCEFCGDFSHSGGECLVSKQTTNEQVNYANTGTSNFQSRNRYQPNQGNFNSNNYGSRPQNPPGFQSNRNQDDGSKLDKILDRFEKFEAEARQKDKNQATAFHHLEVQISQLATSIQGRNQGGLPSTTETNPKEQVKAVELRSGKALNDPHGKKPIKVNDEPNVDEASSSNTKAREEVIVEDETPEVRPPPPPLYVPKVPFPSRLKKTLDNHKFHKFLEIFKKLQINVSLADALREMPQYAKFLKDIIMNKRSWKDKGTISLTENCSSIILSDLPTKLKDPGSFTIPCTIGNLNTVNCLCDLGASINLIPLFLFRNLFGNQSVKQTSKVLQLPDQSIKKPYGVVEDVLVKVDKFIFHVDFVILDYAVDKNCPMILGRPFMNTGRALIDVHAGKLTLRIDEDSVEFDMKKLM
ncbi:uncharacterized protein LOC126656934 [Mercurialis annua]|uniref:uncharacterized protein LOC126656934 n=1 Tax=Mercurialis annua TaxID=3986 RepID=UPI00215E468C|nr:uncharacterized protein LOC126656934 [Mercurialis annua]